MSGVHCDNTTSTNDHDCLKRALWCGLGLVWFDLAIFFDRQSVKHWEMTTIPGLSLVALILLSSAYCTWSLASEKRSSALIPLCNDRHLGRRRDFLSAVLVGFGVTICPSSIHARAVLSQDAFDPVTTRPEAGRTYFPAITPPFRNRATYRYSLGRNMWALEQLLTFGNVTATIRSTIVLMEGSKDLWVLSPLYPTGELCSLLDELPGTVRYIVLSCNAFEHAAPLQSFAKRYPDATVWIAPGQYFGSVGKATSYKVLEPLSGVRNDPVPPWTSEFDYKILYIDIPENAGPVSEVAFFHRPTRTLLATDAVVFIPEHLPAGSIFETYFGVSKVRDDSTFWPRTVLQAIFLPLRVEEEVDVNNIQPRSLYYPGFAKITNRLVRAPILRGFNDARGAKETKAWIEDIAVWDFDRIITSHFASPISARPGDFLDTFAYLFDDEGIKGSDDTVYCQDWELLDSLNGVIAKYNLGAPASFNYKKGCINQ